MNEKKITVMKIIIKVSVNEKKRTTDTPECKRRI